MMKAVLLAAGIGKRLGPIGQEIPKCLLQIGGQTLLERHVRALRKLGASPIIIVIGYKKELVERELAAKFPELRVASPLNGKGGASAQTAKAPSDADVLLVANPAYHHGNLLSLWATHKLVANEPFVLLDADVLGDERLIQRIIETPHVNSFLIDRNFPEGEEEMHAAANAGRVLRFERGLKSREFEIVGESVGFFKFSAEGARAIFRKMQEYLVRSEVDAHYDDALRDILTEVEFGFEDITGLPWIEIDFEEDARRAETEILPKIDSAAQLKRCCGSAL
jgi:choline kinase